MPTKYNNISATFIYTVEISVDLDGEYDCLNDAEQELEEKADQEWRTPIAHLAEVEMVDMKFDEEEESSEEESSEEETSEDNGE